MKRVLLDTHVLLWRLAGSAKLGTNATALLDDPRNDIFVSAAAVWEISIKRALGKLDAPSDVISAIDDAGFKELPIRAFHAQQAGNLPAHHNDPFDRIMVAQAQIEGLELMTQDAKLPAYGIKLIPADH